MMVFLIRDVPLEDLDISRADGKGTIAALPVEGTQLGRFGLQPLARLALQFADEDGNALIAREHTQDVKMICDAADDQRGRTARLAGSGEISVALVAQALVLQKSAASFGGEHDAHVDAREG